MRHLERTNNNTLYAICFIGFVFTLHHALPVYINSTYLSQYVSEKNVGLIYTFAAIATIIALSSITTLLRKFGNFKTVTTLILGQAVALTGLIFSPNTLWVIAAFLAYTVCVNLIVFSIDVFVESESDNRFTGGIRGLFLTSLNMAWVLSPLLVGALVATDDYWKVYAAAIALLFPFLFLLHKNLRTFKDPQYPTTSFKASIRKVWNNKNFYHIFSITALLNTFYAWMVIYTPIYLHEHIGFDWETIGFMFTIMLLPYVLFQFPLGKLADSKFGEKEFLGIGFIIMSLSTISLSFIGKEAWMWIVLLFTSRIGASIAEVMVETYFFKQIHTKDSNILSLFRMTRPTAYIISPIITFVGLYFLDYKYLFTLLGILMIYSLRFIIPMKDTR